MQIGLAYQYHRSSEARVFMDFLKRIKLAIFSGAIIGAAHGTIDILIRVFKLSFEWFELYQTLMVSLIAFTLGFFLLGLIIEVFRKIANFRISHKDLAAFYFVTGTITLISFYIMITVNRIIFFNLSFFSQKKLLINLALLLLIGTIYILALTKLKNPILNFLYPKTSKNKLKEFVQNLLFSVIIFIIVSLVTDIFLLNHEPSAKANEGLTDSPNVIWIVVDAMRYDHLGTYGYQLNITPNIDDLAMDSVVFDNAITPGVYTFPVFESISTGKYGHNLESVKLGRSLSQNETTLAEILRSNGYSTAAFVGSPYQKAKYGFGQGFEVYKDRTDFFEFYKTYDKFSLRETLTYFLPFYNKLLRQDGERTAEEINGDIFKWLDNNKQNPFFLFTWYYEPHVPYTQGKEYLDPSEDIGNFYQFEKFRNDKVYSNVSDYMLNSLTKLYDAEIESADYNIGQLLDRLEELGIKDNTMIIISADHGEGFNEHGLFRHGYVYQEVIHVPLIIYYPKELNPQRINNAVSLIDIFPTILNITNIKQPNNIDGFSLAPIIKKEPGISETYVLSELYGTKYELSNKQVAVIQDGWKLIVVEPESKLISNGLYNLNTDPKEKTNLYQINKQKRDTLSKLVPS
jgi:arylsulfatase A-like enzyme